MKKKKNDQNFIRNLNTCETADGTTTICSDKIGTITQSKITFSRFYQIGSPAQRGISSKIGEEKKAGDKMEKIEKVEFVCSSSECTLLQLLEP